MPIKNITSPRFPPVTNELKNTKNVQMVPIRELIPYVQEDRRALDKSDLDTMSEPTQKLIPRLTQLLRDKKTKLNEALLLKVDVKTSRATLADGNTRLVAIEDAGYTHAPVRVHSWESLHGFGNKLKVDTSHYLAMSQEEWDKHDKPSDFGFSGLPVR